jgi:hypothetical protein
MVLREIKIFPREGIGSMDLTNRSPVIVILVVALIIAIAAAIWMYLQKRRTQNLRSRFGPEYDKVVEQHRDRNRAEAELERRAKRVSQFSIQPLRSDERLQYAEEWHREQSLFVDDPQAAVQHADALVQEVMRQRGYPVGDFEQSAADLSVDHPAVVQNYRTAHTIASREGRRSTEDLRKAMVSYRDLFEDLLETTQRTEEIRR